MAWQEPLTSYSDRLSPVFVRDLRQLLRSTLIVATFLILQAAALGMTGIELVLSWISEGTISGTFLSTALPTFLGVGFGLIIPLTALNALQPELSRGRNVELLLSSSLSRWQIVFGKWLTMTILSGLLLSSIAPFLTVRYYLGSVDLPQTAALFFSVIATNATMNAAVIGASGFQNYLARGLTIFSFWMVLMITSSVNLASLSMGSSLSSKIGALVSVPLCATVVAVLGLQIGRAKLKLFSTIENPASTGGIFALLFVFPILQGVALASGGSVTVVILSILWLVFAFLIDRGQRRSYRYPATNEPG
ncbi:MAG: hypothetical protein AAF357_14680 [Verrucomicrobiota bacterium]